MNMLILAYHKVLKILLDVYYRSLFVLFQILFQDLQFFQEAC